MAPQPAIRMRRSFALVLPALVCLSCAKPPARGTAEPPAPAVVREAQAASRKGQSERAAVLWEQVLAANPSGQARTRALWGAAEARLATSPRGRHTPGARRHVQALADQAVDAETQRALLLALRALDQLSALEEEHHRVRIELEQRTEALRKAASALLDPKTPE
jgi:hypothetical protein